MHVPESQILGQMWSTPTLPAAEPLPEPTGPSHSAADGHSAPNSPVPQSKQPHQITHVLLSKRTISTPRRAEFTAMLTIRTEMAEITDSMLEIFCKVHGISSGLGLEWNDSK